MGEDYDDDDDDRFLIAVRNIPKFKDGANWSRATF